MAISAESVTLSKPSQGSPSSHTLQWLSSAVKSVPKRDEALAITSATVFPSTIASRVPATSRSWAKSLIVAIAINLAVRALRCSIDDGGEVDGNIFPASTT